MKSKRMLITLSMGLGLTVALLYLSSDTGPAVALPGGTSRYVAPGGTDSSDCSDPGSPCRTIQYTIIKAVAGDTINVAAGTYTENVTIDLNLTLQGAGAGSTIVAGNGNVTQQRVMTINTGSVVIISYMTITDGKTPSGLTGGGIYNAGTLTLDHCTVNGNATGNGSDAFFIGSGGSGGDGGGIYNAGSLTLNDCVVSDNITGRGGRAAGFPSGGGSGGDGGGIYNDGVLTMTNSTVSNNTAGDGGSGSWDFESFGGSGGDGGGIYDAGTLTLDYSTVSGNTTGNGGEGGFFSSGPGGDGGGIYAKGILTMTNSTVRGNSTGNRGDGGGVYLSENYVATLDNIVIIDNQALGRGAGLSIWQSSVHLIHNTIARNTGGDGSGMHIAHDYSSDSSNVTLTNSILVNHAVGITVTKNSTVTVNGILWYNTPITMSQFFTTAVIVQNQYTGNPAFAFDGYHLRGDSAAIDKGVSTDVFTDIDGDTRPYGFAPDLGADEFTGVPAPGSNIFLPILLRNH